MTKRRVLCGWVNFDERVTSHDPLRAMLAAEGLGLTDVQIQASEIGMIACTYPACSTATDLGAGCVAAVLGRPRWPDADLRERAETEVTLPPRSSPGANPATTCCRPCAAISPSS